MSNSTVLCQNLMFFNQRSYHRSLNSLSLRKIAVQLSSGRGGRFGGLVPNAKKTHSKKRSWWRKFFFDEDDNWLGSKDEDMFDDEEFESSGEVELSESEKFEAWKNRAQAIIKLREEEEDMTNGENRRWEDWLVDETTDASNSSWDDNLSDGFGKDGEDIRGDPSEMNPDNGLVKSARDLIFGKEYDDMMYEERVFRYASSNSAKFLVVLVVIPWALDFLVHDYVLMPFLDRYVKTVPLAAEMLDLRRQQKLEIVKELNVEKSRFRLEVEIGKSPPLSEKEVWLELRHRALDLRDEWRLKNRTEFANIWSDMVFGISLFIILYFNQTKVALLKFTGYKIINNISDTGKAFLIILITDIFLGYHSESGWQTLLEIIVEHYGIDVDQSAITIFVCLVPVVIDACVKLWLFKFLPRLSPTVSNIFQEMTRH